ncbi:DnaD domain protein [Streptococcus thermophilus]|uniref:DnaD domain protein n=1 Tax=Streptococcus thermophilus TaxID=1308 RepID=UPI002FE4D71A
MTKNKTKTKVYFWLKFDKKFFDNLFIKRLRDMSGGYAMTVIYIRLMLESLETDCVLYYEGYLDNLIQELALKLDVSEDDVNMTMAYFTKCGLIQIDTDGNARFPQAEALLEQETNWSQYKRKQRKVGHCPTKLDNVQPMSNHCPTEIEKEIEKEKELDIETEVEVEDRNRQMPSSAADGQSDFNIFEYYQERIGPLDGYQMEKLKDYIDIDNMEIMLVKRAIDRAADNSKRSFGYINSILKSWSQNGIKTIAQQDEEQRTFEGRKNNDNKTVKFGPACSKY